MADQAIRHGSEIPRLPKASEILADELRNLILGQGLKPGAPLPSEAELMTESHLSRGTVREALRLLEADNLVSIKRGPGGGISVRHPDPSHISRSFALILTLSEATLKELFDFRKLLEPAAAAIAAREATEEQKELLIENARGLGDPKIAHHAAFHRRIAEATNNNVLSTVLRALTEAVEWQASEESLAASQLAGTDAAHKKISEAISSGDSVAAEKMMLRHIREFEKLMSKQGRLTEPVIPRSRWRARRNQLLRRGLA